VTFMRSARLHARDHAGEAVNKRARKHSPDSRTQF
jgi:hypothetical protein